jgi:hypothetical protein
MEGYGYHRGRMYEGVFSRCKVGPIDAEYARELACALRRVLLASYRIKRETLNKVLDQDKSVDPICE